MQIYYDKDADLSLTKGKIVAIIGYGSQGHTHAASLKDSSVKVVVGLRRGDSQRKAEAAGFEVLSVANAAKKADMVTVLLPDENQPVVYKNEIEPNLRQDAALAFVHGFNIHYNQIVLRADLGVIMVAPRDPGRTVRSEFLRGGGAPSPIAIYQDKSGKARDITLSYVAANGGAKGDVIETNFHEETETDLFGEQAILCGGVVELIKTGFETLTEAGYTLEMAYFGRLHEMKLTVDLIYEGGIADMNYSISSNTEYGEHVAGVEVTNDRSREAMHNALKRIQTGECAKMFVQESAIDYASMTTRHRLAADHQIERVDAQLRSMMPWIAKSGLADLNKN